MANSKILLEITQAQLNALKNITDEASSSIGMGDPTDDKNRTKWVRLIDRALQNNGYKRDFK